MFWGRRPYWLVALWAYCQVYCSEGDDQVDRGDRRRGYSIGVTPGAESKDRVRIPGTMVVPTAESLVVSDEIRDTTNTVLADTRLSKSSVS